MKENRAAANKAPGVHSQTTELHGSIQKGITPRDHQILASHKGQVGTDPKESVGPQATSPSHSSALQPPTATVGPHHPNTRANGATSGNKVHQSLQTHSACHRSPSRVRAADSDRPVAIGTWNCTDSWAQPHGIKIPVPDSFYDIDFSTRPPNDIVIKVAHTVTDRSGKQVVQTPVNPANKVEFPDLATAAKSPQQGDSVPPHNRTFGKKKEQHVSPQKPTPSKVPEVGSVSVPVTKKVKAGSNATIVNAKSSPLVTNKEDHTSQVTASNRTHLQPPAEGKASLAQLTGILRYFRPLKSAQTDYLEKKTPAPPSPMHEPAPAPVPSPSLKPIQGHLCTEGAAFLAQLPKSGVLNSPKKASSGNDLEVKPASSEPSKVLPAQETMAQRERQQKFEGGCAGARDSTSAVDEVVAGINAKTVAPPKSALDSSNKSVRGRADEQLSCISVNLSFEDAFKGRNASAPSQKSVVLYEGRQPNNPYQIDDQLGDYEPGQLRGWDGNWAPAPVEWDLRDMFDYRKPQHQDSIKNFIIDRYKAFKKGLCPALKIDDEHFTSGASLAIGLTHFGKPIDPNQHHHLTAQDPFTLNKLHQTAARSTEYYVRHYDRLFGSQQKKRPQKPTEAEKKAMQEAYDEMMRDIPPNKFKPVANIYIRPARVVDLPQIRNIHNHWTRVSVVTAERVELTDREWRTRYDDCAAERYPFIVAVLRRGRTAQRTEKIVGFAYAEDFGGEQSMWRHTCELQLFVDPYHLRQGIGKNLMDFILRGLNPLYVYHDVVEFIYSQDELNRYDMGGARVLSNIIISFPYVATEEEQSKWIWDWLTRVFEFQLQGILKGIGRKGNGNKP